ncbi:hypothetical protein BJ508DRAFT_418300 [Ascobolus immersus RN42]|uniref:Exonuclease domain-containing protein n=1 Tax=Ascobolus immersus RN42 TaxID=1160509 RepID=A0A3N4HN27_ASCIM|nr:hypothetical protein BJ508DRAFT_418300 [Ascobolus immersus RN42]
MGNWASSSLETTGEPEEPLTETDVEESEGLGYVLLTTGGSTTKPTKLPTEAKIEVPSHATPVEAPISPTTVEPTKPTENDTSPETSDAVTKAAGPDCRAADQLCPTEPSSGASETTSEKERRNAEPMKPTEAGNVKGPGVAEDGECYKQQKHTEQATRDNSKIPPPPTATIASNTPPSAKIGLTKPQEPALEGWTTIDPSEYGSAYKQLLSLRPSLHILRELLFPMDPQGPFIKTSRKLKQRRRVRQGSSSIVRAYCVNCGMSQRAQQESCTPCYVHPHQKKSAQHCIACKGCLQSSLGCKPRISEYHSFTEHIIADPSTCLYHSASFIHTPSTRRAVVIDCKTAELANGTEALMHLTAIDFFTGALLIDSPVSIPNDDTDTYWRECFTGVTPEALANAEKTGKALTGVDAAKAELFKYVSSSTIIVGYTVRKDLKALQLYHTNVVDWQIVYKTTSKNVGVKALCKELLGREIRKDGYDCVEDVMAVRELVLYWIGKNKEGRVVAGDAAAHAPPEGRSKAMRWVVAKYGTRM